MMDKTKKMTTIAMLIALSVVFHMVESMIPIPIVIPGFKLGLANIIGMVTLYLFGVKEMIGVNCMRVLLASLLKGTLLGTGFWLSFGGILLSVIASVIAYKRTSMSVYGVSVAGSVFHSIGQVIVVSIIYQQFFMQTLLPFLMLLAIPTGICIAYIASEVLKRIRV